MRGGRADGPWERTALIAAALVGVIAAAQANGQAPAVWNPHWQDGQYWVVESPLLQGRYNELKDEVGPPHVVGTWQTRFTVRMGPGGKAHVIIEPAVVGQYEFGGNTDNYELVLERSTLLVEKAIVRGMNGFNKPFEDIESRRPTDPVTWWRNPWEQSSVYPGSLVLALPVCTQAANGGVTLATRSVETVAHPQVVVVQEDGSISVELQDAEGANALAGQHLIFRRDKPWYEVVDAEGHVVNHITEVGTR